MSENVNFPRDSIIDPSLFASDRTYQQTAEKVGDNYDIFNFSIPRSFIYVLDRHSELEAEYEETPPSLRFFSSYADLPPVNEIRNTIRPLDVGQFSAEGYFETYGPVYQSLRRTLPYQNSRQRFESRYDIQGDPLTDILFEEYVFLQERSGMVSRIKNTINNFIEAGISTIEMSEDAWDYFTKNYIMDSGQRRKSVAKTMGKWIVMTVTGLAAGAVGGLPAAVLSSGGTKLAIDAAFLLVIDP